MLCLSNYTKLLKALTLCSNFFMSSYGGLSHSTTTSPLGGDYNRHSPPNFITLLTNEKHTVFQKIHHLWAKEPSSIYTFPVITMCHHLDLNKQ